MILESRESQLKTGYNYMYATHTALFQFFQITGSYRMCWSIERRHHYTSSQQRQQYHSGTAHILLALAA